MVGSEWKWVGGNVWVEMGGSDWKLVRVGEKMFWVRERVKAGVDG